MRDEFDNRIEPVDSDWEPCPQGTLGRVAESLRAKQAAAEAMARRNLLTGVVAVLAIVLGTGIAAREYGQRDMTMDLMPVGDISCDHARSIIPRLFTRQVCRNESSRVRYHIDVCPRCSKYYMRLLSEWRESERASDVSSSATPSPPRSEKPMTDNASR